MPSEVKFTQDFLEHAAVCTSQYDSTCRAMAAEILALRAEIAKPWEHSDHWRNPETGYIECSCCCDWALDAERDHKRIAELQSQLDALSWTKITPENLPKVGHEVFNPSDPKDCVRSVKHDWGIGYKLTAEEWLLNGWTHFRPINPPPPSSAKGGNDAK